MTREEWLIKAREDTENLISLVGSYHPSAGRRGRHEMEITAPMAEAACDIVREKISQEESGDPIQRLKVALQIGDIAEINSVLNGAWFGVPESTDCWRITGFKEAVELIGDLPEEE